MISFLPPSAGNYIDRKINKWRGVAAYSLNVSCRPLILQMENTKPLCVYLTLLTRDIWPWVFPILKGREEEKQRKCGKLGKLAIQKNSLTASRSSAFNNATPSLNSVRQISFRLRIGQSGV